MQIVYIKLNKKLADEFCKKYGFTNPKIKWVYCGNEKATFIGYRNVDNN